VKAVDRWLIAIASKADHERGEFAAAEARLASAREPCPNHVTSAPAEGLPDSARYHHLKANAMPWRCANFSKLTASLLPILESAAFKSLYVIVTPVQTFGQLNIGLKGHTARLSNGDYQAEVKIR
jgi:hypothetical protein